jgi:lysophospholipase L1-like esterase
MPLAYNNALAHAFRVTVVDEQGEAVDLSGVGCAGAMLNAHGVTVSPIIGTVSGNTAEVILPVSCYVVPGNFKFTMNLTKPTSTEGIDAFSTAVNYAKNDLVVYSGVVYRFTAAHTAGAWTGTDVVADAASRTIMWVDGFVEQNVTESIVDPGTPVGNITTAIAQASGAATAATAAAAEAEIAAGKANEAHDSFADGLALAIGYTEKRQYIDFSTEESGKYWKVSNGAKSEDTSSSYKRYAATNLLPAGVYSFRGLSPNYCVVEYSDLSAVTLRSLNGGSTDRFGTVTISNPFTLYASTTANATWCAFVDGSVIPDEAVSGSVFDAESTRMDDAALENSNVVSIFESFVMIGDSLTAGFVSNGSGQTYTSAEAKLANRNWPSYFGLATGRTVTNLGKGSSAARDWRYGNQSLNVDISDADVDTYCYMVGLGVNDSRSSLTVGSSSDIKTDKANNADTFYGNYDFVIRQLREYKSARISQAKIFVFTMQDSEANAEQYNAAIRYVASLYDDVHCIDLHDIYKKQLASSPLTDLWIGNHSRPLGYALLADMIRRAVNGYMCKHPTSFAYDPWEPLT